MANKEKVEVKGGGDLDGAVFQNAATEHTLKALYDLFKKKEHDTKGADKVVTLHKKAIEANIKAQDQSTESYKQATKELDEMKKKSKEFRETISDVVGVGLGVTFSLLGTAGKTLLGFFTDSFDAFKQTSQVGAGFNNNLVELRRSAAAAAIPLNDFVDIIKANSVALAALGGTTTEGAKSFGLMSKEFRGSEVGQQLQAMGYSAGQLNQILADQIEIEMRTGKLRGKDSLTLRKETEMLTMDLDKLSKATGIAREQLEKGLKQSIKDGRLLAMQQKLSGKSLVNFRENVALMNANFDPDITNTLTNMMSGFIDPADEFGHYLASLVPNIMDFEQSIKNGTLSGEQAIKGYQDQHATLSRVLSRFSDTEIAANGNLRRLKEYDAELQSLINANTGDAGKQQSAMREITKAFGTFSDFINNLFGDILVGVVDSPVFKDLENTLESLAAVFNQNKGKITNTLMPMINGFLDVINNILKKFTVFLNEDTLNADSIKNFFVDAFNKIKDGISSALGAVFSGFNETPEQKAKREKYEQATPEEKKRMETEDPSLKTSGVFDSMKKGLEGLISLVPSLTDLALFFGVTGGGAFVAGLGIAAGITAVGTAIAGMVLPVGALALAIGLGAGGLGFAFNGLANIIKEITEVFPKLTTFFKSMTEMDPAKLSEAGKSLGPLAENLINLAKGGVIGLIGAGGLDSLATSLIKMSTVDGQKLNAVGPALKSLHEGLTTLNDQSFWDTLTGSIKEFTSGKGISSVVESLTSLEKVDLSKLKSAADVTNFFNALKPFLDENVIKNLPTSMNTVADSLATLASKLADNASKFTNNGLDTLISTLTKVGNIDTTKLEQSITKSLTAFIDGIAKVSETTKGKLADIVRNQDLTNVIGILGKINDISFSNIEKVSSSNVLTNFVDAFTKIGQLNVDTIQNVVSGIGKIGITLNDNLTNNTKGIDEYIKSIDKLTDSLSKLEQKMRDVPNLRTNASAEGGPQASRVFAASGISEISAEDLQKQLNTKMDDLISHIVEMKQNTKDTADAMSGRRSAL